MKLTFLFLLSLLICFSLSTSSTISTSSLSTTSISPKLHARHTKLLNDRLTLNNIKLMEKIIPRSSFVKKSLSNLEDEHEVVIAVKQKNLDILEEEVLKRTTPSSKDYQNWLTYDEVTSLTQNLDSYNEISSWLTNNSIQIVSESKRKDYITARGSINQWEDLLTTTFYQYEDVSVPEAISIYRNKMKKLNNDITDESNEINESDRIFYNRADSYYLPNHLLPHISAIFETVQVPPEYKPNFYVENNVKNNIYKTNLRVNKNNLLNKINDKLSSLSSSSISTLSMNLLSDSVVNIDFLNRLYKINSNNATNPNNSQSVFSTSDEYFSTNDLIRFQNRNNIPLTEPVTKNSHSTTECSSSMSCAEGNLDMQFIMGVAQEISSIYWYVPSSNADPFVLWIKEVSSDSNPPLSNSISWGINEFFESPSVMDSFSTEASKLAALGVTIAVATGDDGAPNKAVINNKSTCLCNFDSSSSEFTATKSPTPWTGNGYFPNFPASNPWVTAVGATMGPEEGKAEEVCSSDNGGIITSGGGFSSYYNTPSWQQSTLDYYFNNHRTKSYTDGYNPNGRAYPDISFIGVRYEIYLSSKITYMYGTSASAPVFAGFISLVNTLRIENNLSPIGFINPTLYEVGLNNTLGLGNIFNATFNDVTKGNNKCCAGQTSPVCCTSGFSASPGWDPTTGWGSIDFTDFSSIFKVATTYIPKSNDDDSTSSNDIGVIVGVIVATLVVIFFNIWLCKCIYASLCKTTAMSNQAN